MLVAELYFGIKVIQGIYNSYNMGTSDLLEIHI